MSGMGGQRDRHARVGLIKRLDPVADCRQITGLFAKDFQSLLIAQVLLGLMMTYAVPRMSRVLSASGQLANGFGKRLTDTVILQSAMLDHGFESGPGRVALRRMNEMHRHWRIAPEDFAMVSCEQAVVQVRLAELYGWRPVGEVERTAITEYCKLQARFMGVRGVPDTYEGMVRFRREYLDAHAYFEPQNAVLTAAMFDYFDQLVPRPARAAYRAVVLGIADARVVEGCGHRVRSAPTRYAATQVMRLLGRRDPRPEDEADPLESFVRTTYPDGYDIAQVGTHEKR